MAFTQSFYSALEAHRDTAVADRVFEHQLERLPASKVLGAAAAEPMLIEAPAHVIRNAGVKTVVCTAQDVQAEPIHG